MAKNNMEKQKFITIMEWMLELKLRPPELIVFALIWGFSQDGVSYFRGTADYISRWTNTTRQNVMAILKTLQDRHLIEKVTADRDRRFMDYRVCQNSLQNIGQNVSKDITDTCKNSLQNVSKKVTEICQNSLHHNNSNIDIDNNTNTTTKESKKKSEYLDFPYSSPEFIENWQMLIRQPKWKNKSEDALKKCLKFLAKHSEADAIAIMEQTIANGWQGLFELKTNRGNGTKQQESAIDRLHIDNGEGYGEATLQKYLQQYKSNK